MSAFVGLEYSESERRKMLDVVDLFGEHDTRDELGIGSVRAALQAHPLEPRLFQLIAGRRTCRAAAAPRRCAIRLAASVLRQAAATIAWHARTRAKFLRSHSRWRFEMKAPTRS